jgi:hypothetical protein
MRKRFSSTCAAAGLLAGLVLVPAGSANANENSFSCDTDHHHQTTNIVFTQDLAWHYWDKLEFRLGGSDTGGESNFHAWLRYMGETNVYDRHSSDTVDSYKWYTWQVDKQTRRRESEVWHSTAVFDTLGSDERCTADLYW